MTAPPAPDRPGAAAGALAAPAGGRRRAAVWLALALAALYLLHNDVWFWREPRLVLGLPAGLLYHALYCVAAAALAALAVRFAWPPPGIAGAEEAAAAGRGADPD